MRRGCVNKTLSKSVHREDVWLRSLKQDSEEDRAIVLMNEWAEKKWKMMHAGDDDHDDHVGKEEENRVDENEEGDKNKATDEEEKKDEKLESKENLETIKKEESDVPKEE